MSDTKPLLDHIAKSMLAARAPNNILELAQAFALMHQVGEVTDWTLPAAEPKKGGHSDGPG